MMAKQFVTLHRMKSVKMLWDSGFSSWNYYGIPGQPAALLFDASGTYLSGYSGIIDYRDVLSRVKPAPLKASGSK